MSRSRTRQEAAAGKLISAIQKVWGEYAGEPGARVHEEAMHSCHSLLHAAKEDGLIAFLNGRSVMEYIGPTWVRRHPQVLSAIQALEDSIVASPRV